MMDATPTVPREGNALAGNPRSNPALVSVVIPVLDGSDVIADQLEALERQSYAGEWEVIVADNGSTDGTQHIAASFASRLPGLRVIQAVGRPGPSHARNVGAREATGGLLLFCDADDVVSEEWVHAMASVASERLILAGTGIEARDPFSVDPSERREPSPDSFRFLPWNRSSNIGVHRRAFEELGGFDEERSLGEDVDFCWRAQLAGYRLVFVDDAFIAYRDRSSHWSAMRRQFRFGRAAPGLYLEYRESGAPQPSFRWVLRDLVRAIARLPTALLRRDLRGWLNQVSGGLGRLLGRLTLKGS